MHMIECSPKGLWLGNVATFNWSSLVHCWVFHVAGEVPVWVGSPEREQIFLRGSHMCTWDWGCSQTSGESISLVSSLWRKNRHMETSMDVNNSLFIGTWEHIKIGGPSANGIMPLGFFSRGRSSQIQTEIKRESCMFIGTTLMCRVMSKELGCPRSKHLPKDGHKWKK